MSATRRFRRSRRAVDPGRELLERAAAAGLITEQHAAALDEWAGDLATQKCRGELSPAEIDARIVERALADAAKRGKA